MKNISVFVMLGAFAALSVGHVEEMFRWKKVEYENLPYSEKSWVGPYRYYIPENNGVGSIAYHVASGLIMTANVRLRPGVPTSVGAFCIGDYPTGSSPKLWGFPNYELNALHATDFATQLETEEDDETRIHKHHNKHHNNHHYVPIYVKPTVAPIEQPLEIKRIASVFQVNGDEKCDRVLFMDHGQIQYYLNATYIIQKPSLWIIGLPSNGCETRQFPIIRRRELPDKIAAMGSYGFMHVVPDYQSDDCADVLFYITNTFHSYLTVYDYKKDDFWTFDHETFKPVIAESHMVFRGTYNFDMPLGLFSIVLGYPDEDGDRTAYYTSVAGTAQYAVSTRILKNKRRSPANFNSDDFRIMGYLGCNSQPLKSVIDYATGVVFTADVQTNEIHCWKVNSPLNPDTRDVVYKSDKYFFGPQMLIDSRGYLWFQSTSIPVLLTSDNPLDLTQVNSRFFRVKVTDAIRGTLCNIDG
ncbi:L-dopachrome tautomerase yellow-f2-like [Phlebotomus argentipes]|uniref:L-dopachrome tautomerase yellow-f2-like n=1 Tax=Phlebotomus argentipes TaxID=94469 RepID=UPI002893362D|nr:L-dopachrome tautomerase yellow-f2-like [Phlebotomus argentipes]